MVLSSHLCTGMFCTRKGRKQAIHHPQLSKVGVGTDSVGNSWQQRDESTPWKLLLPGSSLLSQINQQQQSYTQPSQVLTHSFQYSPTVLAFQKALRSMQSVTQHNHTGKGNLNWQRLSTTPPHTVRKMVHTCSIMQHHAASCPDSPAGSHAHSE